MTITIAITAEQWHADEARRRAIYETAKATGGHLAGIAALLAAGEISPAIARIAGLTP